MCSSSLQLNSPSEFDPNPASGINCITSHRCQRIPITTDGTVPSSIPCTMTRTVQMLPDTSLDIKIFHYTLVWDLKSPYPDLHTLVQSWSPTELHAELPIGWHQAPHHWGRHHLFDYPLVWGLLNGSSIKTYGTTTLEIDIGLSRDWQAWSTSPLLRLSLATACHFYARTLRLIHGSSSASSEISSTVILLKIKGRLCCSDNMSPNLISHSLIAIHTFIQLKISCFRYSLPS